MIFDTITMGTVVKIAHVDSKTFSHRQFPDLAIFDSVTLDTGSFQDLTVLHLVKTVQNCQYYNTG